MKMDNIGKTKLIDRLHRAHNLVNWKMKEKEIQNITEKWANQGFPKDELNNIIHNMELVDVDDL